MVKLSRRAVLESLASTALLAAGPAHALTCDVTRSRSGNVSTKSYNCTLGENKSISATFMRVSDMLADRINGGRLPVDYAQIMGETKMIENRTLQRFTDLADQFSYPFETNKIILNFDGRGGADGAREDLVDQPARWRTLGVWDDTSPEVLPFFPLPEELRRAIVQGTSRYSEFLRFATQNDFADLAGKTAEYLNIWSTKKAEDPNEPLFVPDAQEDMFNFYGNLALLDHIKAGTVDGFVPLFFSDFVVGECTGRVEAGAHFVPPALYVDMAVCANTGSEPIAIQDFFGVDDRSANLRAYDPQTPPGVSAFGWQPQTIAPGQSVVALQRLLFGAEQHFDTATDAMIRPQRAVFGEAQLPKGVIVGGQDFPFDGRSHNALIVGSYYDGASCPFLMSWCEVACEWIMLGKAIAGQVGPENAREDTRHFGDLRTKFRLIEKEHERTFISTIALEITLRDGTQHLLPHADTDIVLDIGRSHDFAFELPQDVAREDVMRSALKITGYYEVYGPGHVAERRAKLLEEA